MKLKALICITGLGLLGGWACGEKVAGEGSAPPGGDGDSGFGGQGGDGPVAPIACDRDEDCVDGRFCNGEESCVDGICQLGSDPCADFEEEGCVITCSEGDSSAECTSNVEDEDEDGHAATGNTCSADPEVPRDDCDDTEGTAYPENEEVCDGIDNDCDGVDDFGEGLGLGGSVLTIATGTTDDTGGVPVVTWSEEHRIWVVVAGAGDDLRFWRFEPDGTLIGTYANITPGTKVRSSQMIDAAWNNGTLLLSYGSGESSASTLDLVQIRFTGDELVPEQVTAPKRVTNGVPLVEVAAVPQGWGALSTDGSAGNLLRMSAATETIPPLVVIEPMGYRVGLGASSDRLTVVWWEPVGAGDAFEGFQLSYKQWGGDGLDEVLPKTTLIPASTADLAYGTVTVSEAGQDAFVFARRASGAMSVSRIDADGAVVCGPVELPGAPTLYGNSDVLNFSSNSMAGVFLTSDAEVYRVPTNCKVPSGLGVTYTEQLGAVPLSAFSLRSASGSLGHAFVWNENDDGFHLRMRVFGNAFCDEVE